MRRMFSKNQIIDVVSQAMSSGIIPSFAPIKPSEVQCITDVEGASLDIIFPKYVFPYFVKLEDEDGNYVIIETKTDNVGSFGYDIKLDEGNTLVNAGVTWDDDGRFIIECDFDNDTHEYSVVELLYYIYIQAY